MNEPVGDMSSSCFFFESQIAQKKVKISVDPRLSASYSVLDCASISFKVKSYLVDFRIESPCPLKLI